MGNPVTHFEINSNMAPELQKFYAGLFGWKIDANNPMSYGMVDTLAGRGINGGIGPTQDSPNLVTFYVEVDDTDKTLAKVEKFGGKTIMPTTKVMDMVTIALFADPEGNCIGLARGESTPEAGAHTAGKGQGRPVLHFEIGGNDATRLQKFYAELFDWHINADNPMNYGEVDTHAGRGIGGGIGPAPGVTFYVGVSNLKKTLEKAATLGGKTVMEPTKVTPTVEIAQFADPEGNRIGLMKE